MARKTVAELLAAAKKKRDQIQKEAIATVKDLPGVSKIPAVRAGVAIAEGLTAMENAVIDRIADKAIEDFAGLQIGPGQRTRREFDPNNPITRLLQDRLQFDTEPSRMEKKPRIRSDKQMVNDEIQSIALKSINRRARKKDGSFKKGWSQKKVMRLAQKECTKERERLGLCKRKSTRKGQVRKTARRAYKN